jgi:hypothetical protein
MDDAELEKVRERWLNVCKLDADIDPYMDHDFETLLLGFLLGAGVPIEQARSIVIDKAPSEQWPL